MNVPGRMRLISYSTIARFRLAVSVTLAVAISFVFASCEVINNPIRSMVPPESITISPATIEDMAPGEWRQLTATVGPAGALQAVTWSISPANVGIIQFGGLRLDLPSPCRPLSPTITITARVANHPTILDKATITVLEPISITVPDIPYQGQVDIELRDTGGNRVATGWADVQGGTATFDLLSDSIGVAFVDEGYFEVLLFIRDDENQSTYRIEPQPISRETNNIAFGGFTEMPPVTITVTEIPDGQSVTGVTLRIARTGKHVITMWPKINGNTATLTVHGVPPGTYDVILDFFVDHEDETAPDRMVYIGRSKNIVAGTNQIPFAGFVALQPITITVTGIPLALQRSQWGDIFLYIPGTNNKVGLGTTNSVRASTAVQVWFYAAAGHHDVVLWFVGNLVGTLEFIAPGRNITAGNNTIPFSAFRPR